MICTYTVIEDYGRSQNHRTSLLCPVEQIWFRDSETRRFNAVEIVEVGGVVWGNPDV